MKFSGKMCIMIILKVTKNPQDFTLSLEDTFFKKPQGVGGVKLTLPPPPPAALGLKAVIAGKSLISAGLDIHRILHFLFLL